VQDVAKLQISETFDLVTAAYLLNYARNKDELLAMCRAVAGCLRPGGRFITVNTNPALAVEHYHKSRKYGYIMDVEGALREGARLILTFFVDGQSFQFSNFHLSVATHEWALQTAGLKAVRWHRPQLAPDGEAELGREYWQEMLTYPPITFLECRR
jgi:hypothetical protein